jgi:hypothetical protein
VPVHSPAPAERGYLGVRIAGGSGAGAAVEWVEPGSGAARAGIQVGDLIGAVDGREVGTFEDLVEALSSKSPGSTVALQVRREGRRLEISATLGSWGAPSAGAFEPPARSESPELPPEAARSWRELVDDQRAALDELLGRVREDLATARERLEGLADELGHWRDAHGRELIDAQRARLEALVAQAREQRDRQIEHLGALTEELAELREKLAERALAWRDFELAPQHAEPSDHPHAGPTSPPALEHWLEELRRADPGAGGWFHVPVPQAPAPFQPLQPPSPPAAANGEVRALRDEVAALREELAELRELMRERR